MKAFKQKTCWLLSSFLIVFSLLVAKIDPSILHTFELIFQDAHFKWRGPVPPGPEVVIAAIDEKSIDDLGRWPWSRKTMANLVDKLVEYDAKIIGFDIVFSSPEDFPQKQLVKNLEDKLKKDKIDYQNIESQLEEIKNEPHPDELFSKAMRSSHRTVTGYFLNHNQAESKLIDDEIQTQSLKNIKPSRFRGFLKSNAELDLNTLPLRTVYGIEANIKTLSKKYKKAGFLSFDVEPDGTIRQLPLVVKSHRRLKKKPLFFPPFSMRILEEFLDGTMLFKVNEMGVEKVLIDAEDPIVIPVNAQGALSVNYLGPQKTFPNYSISEIINAPSGTLSEKLKGKIVLIGATAKGLLDIRKTPFDPVMPGIEIHATIIDNILQRNFIYEPDWAEFAEICFMILIGIASTLIYINIKPAHAPLYWVGFSTMLFGINHWFFTSKGFWLSNLYPQLEHLLVSASLIIYRYTSDEKQKRYIRDIFGQYVTPKVIDDLIENSEDLKLGGEERELTAYFSDIAGFSTIAEKLTPTQFVSYLNEYLTEMTEILLKHDGTLDKYDGDAIKAFFGAPVYFEDHAKRACWVGIEMQERLNELRVEWEKEDKPEFQTRIGINTGDMVIGNFGSETRKNYGMNGDSVNLAARLEGVNKQYRTQSIISQSTYEQAKDFIEVRELDRIQVVGRKIPVVIYELLAKKGELNENFKQILPSFNQGLEHYKNQRWQEAMEAFNQVLELDSNDGPSLTYLERCLHFSNNPPPKDWNGVFTLTKK